MHVAQLENVKALLFYKDFNKMFFKDFNKKA